MAASSQPYANIHLHFLFGGGCGNCDQFKKTGRFDRLKESLKGTGITIDETNAVRWDMGIKGGVVGKLQRQFIKSFNDWFPCIFLIRKDAYEKADSLSLEDALKCVFLYNGEIDFNHRPPLPKNFNGKNGNRPPIYGFSTDEIKRYINDFLNSPQHAYADTLVSAAPASSAPSVMPVVSTKPETSRPYVDLSLAAPLSGSGMVRPSQYTTSTCSAGSRRIAYRYT